MSTAEDYEALFQTFLKQASQLGIDEEGRARYVQSCFDRIDRKREQETKKLEQEKELRKKELEYEREIRLEEEKTKQLELQFRSGHSTRDDNADSGARDRSHVGAKPIYPKLPLFREKQDDIDSYLFRFETHATALSWDKSKWVTYLSALLEGNALTLYHSLASKGPVDYDVLKVNLLKKFQCTAEGFRRKFREIKPDCNEPFQTFGIELNRLFDRWVALSGVPSTLAGITNLILGEQFLESVSGDLAVFIRERNLVTLDEMVKAAESYRLARPGRNLARKSNTSVFGSVSLSEDSDTASANASYAHNTQDNSRGRGFRHRGNRQGYYNTNTGRQSQSNIGLDPQPNPNNTSPRMFRRGRGRTAFFVQQEICVLCKGKGHSPKICPLKQSQNPCPICGIGGHIRKSCPFVLVDTKQDNTPTTTHTSNAVTNVDPEIICSASEYSGHLVFEKGLVNTTPCSVLRDTGATICGVRKRLVSNNQYIPGTVKCKTFGGEIHVYEKAKVSVSTSYFTGDLICCVLEDPVADLIIGNIEGLSVTNVNIASAVTTRLQAKREAIPHVPLVKVAEELNVTRQDLIKLQKDDPSLTNSFLLLQSDEEKSIGTARFSFVLKHDVLYRVYSTEKETLQQIVVPTALRSSVLSAAHDQLLAGHCGVRRTLNRILQKFFWPGITTDVRRYVQTCDICQKTTPKGKIPPVPLCSMPSISDPFETVAIDLVGPLTPASEQGHKYILTLIDLCTRFPEAVPLKDITSVAVAEALLGIFSRLGFPKQILSDQGTQFNSNLMKEFHVLCGTKAIRTSPYHPQTNGTVERFHGTLKAMLKKVIQNQPKAWYRYLPALLFACRELPSESTGFSPFELMFGRKPRGPISLIAETWTKIEDKSDSKPLYAYLFELKNIIFETAEIAQKNSEDASRRNKHYFDKHSKQRTFAVNDEVLILLPSESNKLLMTWSGPYKVVSVMHPDYKVDVRGKLKILHANMLKKYLRRDTCNIVHFDTPTTSVSVGDLVDWSSITTFLQDESTSSILTHPLSTPLPFEDCQVQDSAAVGVIHDHDDDIGSIPLPMTSSVENEDISKIYINSQLSEADAKALHDVFSEFTDILTDKPGVFNGDLFMNVTLSSDTPIRKKAYDLPFSSKQIVERELKTMLELGVIEKSRSAYSAPVVLVQKKDGSCRFCIDYRALNKITVFDAEPIPDVEELFTRLANSKYFTKIDLAKGYWQIIVNPLDRHKTAFSTHLGLYQWIRMPFGLVSAPAVFARMMRLLELDEASALSFFDDILVHSVTFNEHLKHAKQVLEKLRKSGLTAKPSKITAGHNSLEFLGHVVGNGQLKPEEKKIQKIINIPTPTTKKQVRALLGLLSFYRRYIPNFATMTAPISDLTKESKRRSISWTPSCEEALRQVKRLFSSMPVLQLPRLDQQFILRTDASSVGLGAVLLQEFGDILHPVCFASRKLLEREKNYSTIERECLAIVWAVGKFAKFLWGAEFVLQTDHKPLTYMHTSKFKNSRILRWSLSLQEFRFVIEPLPGTKNTIADLLSRADIDQFVP